MIVNPALLARGHGADPLFGFYLAQRSGSRALLSWLMAQAGPEPVYSYRTVQGFTHWKHTPAEALAPIRYYAGFSEFTPRDLGGRPVVAFSSVRHPAHRIQSLYTVSQRDTLLVYHSLAKRASLDEFYRTIAQERPYYVRNLCCLRIANEPSFAAAQAMMAAHFGAVAPTDRLGALTRLLIDTYRWPWQPLEDSTPDEAKYAALLGVPGVDRIIGENADDVALYEHVVAAAAPAAAPEPAASLPPARERQAVSAATAAPPATRPAHPPCPVCGDPLTALLDGGYCPGCRAPARGRSMAQILTHSVAPNLPPELAGLPLLAFAATGAERTLIERHFRLVTSVSLFGSYGEGHATGVDVRDLSRYPDNSFCGAFGILLFDYFPEHAQALAELHRVIAPGGVLFTLILTGRVKPGAGAPDVTRRIQPRPGYFDYIPAGGELLNVQVGQDWLLAATAQAGFLPQQVRLFDAATGEPQEWFLGFKPAAPAFAAPPAAPPTPAPPAPPTPAAPAAPAIRPSGQMTEAFEQVFTADVDPAFGFRRVTARLSVPSVPREARSASFAEHRVGTAEVLAVMKGAVLVSPDLGRNWDVIRLGAVPELDFEHGFTTPAGDHLLQAKSAADARDRAPGAAGAEVLRFGRDWRLSARSGAPDWHQWHGSRAIDAAGGTIMWAEYPDNKAKYLAGQEHLAVAPRVFRSRDGGTTWQEVFRQTGLAIRHFHTLVADPCVPGQWWLSSGDRPAESRVWLSRDDGDNWVDISDPAPAVALHPDFQGSAQAVFRFTDIWLGEEEAIWGADDWLGDYRRVGEAEAPGRPRIGARMFRARRGMKLAPRDAGWIGNPVRTITDLGPALLVTTEGKRASLPKPQVYLMGKAEGAPLQEIFTIDVHREGGSGFTYSRASRSAQDGVFFSFRGGRDLSLLPTRLLRWAFSFD
jgi:SAM-dependent methyltransferase